MKKPIIFFGNCQAQVMTDCLGTIPFFREHFELIWEHNVHNPNWPARKELLPSQIESCAYLFEQLGRKETVFPHKDDLPSECVIVRYPYLKLQCLWPLLAEDPRNKPEPPKYSAGRFPYGDRLVIDRVEKNIPKAQIFDEYMNINIKDHVNLVKVYEADMQRIREVDRKCDIKVFSLIDKQFRDKKLFNTFAHPTDSFAQFLLLEMLSTSGLIQQNCQDNDKSNINNHNNSSSIIAGIKSFFNQVRFDAMQVPIHPTVCEQFDLKWAGSDTRYLYYNYGHLTFKEYLEIYINYEGSESDFVARTKTLLESEKLQEVQTLLEQAKATYPDSADLLNLQGELMLRKEKFEEAGVLLSQVIERWPNHVEALNNLAVLLSYQNRYDEAMRFLQKVLRLNPYNSTAQENFNFIQNEVSCIKAKELIQKGNVIQAKEMLKTILESDNQHQGASMLLTAIEKNKMNL